jgi:hypothetical protein
VPEFHWLSPNPKINTRYCIAKKKHTIRGGDLSRGLAGDLSKSKQESREDISRDSLMLWGIQHKNIVPNNKTQDLARQVEAA